MVNDNPPEPKESCGYPAGSMERIAAYRKRVEQGEAIFHPQDSIAIIGPVSGVERDDRHDALMAMAKRGIANTDTPGGYSSLSPIGDKNDLAI